MLSLKSSVLSAETAGNAVEKEVLQRVTELLRRYQSNDQAGVVEMLAPRFTILGSNLNVDVRSPVELRALMNQDFAQWGRASFEDIRNIDIRTGDSMATVFFHVNFLSQAGSSPTPIRICTTWTKVDGKWLLTQSASAVPEQ
jgi:hypothetical protein